MSRSPGNLSVILLGLCFATATSATDATTATQECASLRSDSDRLACYDRIFGAPVNAGDGLGVSAERAAEARRDFGLSDADKRGRDPEAAKMLLPESIEATVSAVSRDLTGHFVVTLDNGQVWMQSESSTRAGTRDGDVVTIRKGALGSYFLVTPSRVALRVRRIL